MIRRISDPTGRSSPTLLTNEVLVNWGGVSLSSRIEIITYNKDREIHFLSVWEYINAMNYKGH